MKIRGFCTNTNKDSSLCDVATCQLVKMATFRRFGKPLIFNTKQPKNTRNGRPGGTKIPRNVGNDLSDDMALHRRRL